MTFHGKPSIEASNGERYAILFTQSELNNLIQEKVNQAVTLAIKNLSIEPEYDPDQKVSIDWVCKTFDVSRTTVHKHMNLGLKFSKIGRSTRFARADVESYFENQQ